MALPRRQDDRMLAVWLHDGQAIKLSGEKVLGRHWDKLLKHDVWHRIQAFLSH